jgi:hypothetical protein
MTTTNWEQDQKKREEQSRQEAAASLVTVLAEAKAKGYTGLYVGYNGSGDEGWVEDFRGTKAHAPATSGSEDISTEWKEPLERWADNALQGHGFGGWEVNEGSFGHFEIDTLTGKVRHTHNHRYESYDTTEKEW